MTNEPQRLSGTREWAVIASITLLAGLLRFIEFGRLGLDHFDEGIYAAAGMWSYTPQGLASIDPGLVPYAPPTYPVLVGLAYMLLGPSDLAAITVSILAGTLTIPIVGVIGRRSLGHWGGAISAGFAALSGTHIIFSRMALTDATFLFTWLIAIELGNRFLERPGFMRAILFGVAVGTAQLTKYNGWLVGAIIAVTALIGPILSAADRSRRRLVETFGWGLLAAASAALVYSPWFGFVDRHGGYGALLRHQRSYLGTFANWPGFLRLQLQQLTALSGIIGVAAKGLFLASGVGLLSQYAPNLHAPRLFRVLRGVFAMLLLCSVPTSGWWVGLPFVVLAFRAGRPRRTLLAVWWLLLSILTPFYHPYARLWLPLEALGWVMKGWVVVAAVRSEGVTTSTDDRSRRLSDELRRYAIRRPAIVACLVMWVILGGTWLMTSGFPTSGFPIKELLGPRDSFHLGALRAGSKIPNQVRTVTALARPTLRFYLASPLANRRIELRTAGSLEDLLRAFGSDEHWAIVDTAQLRQEGRLDDVRARLASRWIVVAEVPTDLTPATLLDASPEAVRGDRSLVSTPLLLLRPNRP